jgi:hypothetical protein
MRFFVENSQKEFHDSQNTQKNEIRVLQKILRKKEIEFSQKAKKLSQKIKKTFAKNKETFAERFSRNRIKSCFATTKFIFAANRFYCREFATKSKFATKSHSTIAKSKFAIH